MTSVEKYGVDVEEAVKYALQDLRLSRDEVEVEVLEEPSKGFLGIGAKLAHVKVTEKEVQKPVEEVAAKPNTTPDVVKHEAKPSERDNRNNNRNELVRIYEEDNIINLNYIIDKLY